MKASVFIGISVDGFIARANGDLDFLPPGGGEPHGYEEFMATVDALVMGRKTYEVAQRMGGGSGGYPGVKTYVFSRTIKKPNSKKLFFVNEDAAAYVRRLKEEEEGKDICVMGGGVLAKSLFEADVIDEIGFNIHPVLLGSGIPLFYEMSRQIDLELKQCKELSSGCVLLTYKIKHA